MTGLPLQDELRDQTREQMEANAKWVREKEAEALLAATIAGRALKKRDADMLGKKAKLFAKSAGKLEAALDSKKPTEK